MFCRDAESLHCLKHQPSLDEHPTSILPQCPVVRFITWIYHWEIKKCLAMVVKMEKNPTNLFSFVSRWHQLA